MLLVKEGFPEEDEFVLCTVTNIHFHSVFVKIDDYDKTGLIHISEIAPGRIRNIRDFVEEGKKVVCKVLKVDKKTGHIDLSLRRVNENQKRTKINEVKQEQKAEKIIETIAKNNNLDPKKFYLDLSKIVFEKYHDFKSCFKDAVKDEELLESLGVKKDLAKQLNEIIKVRFKEEDVVIGGALHLKTYESNGIDIIRKILTEIQNTDKAIKLAYAGGGAYNISVKTNNYKDAEKILEKATKKAMSHDNVIADFQRSEKKE